MSELSFHCRSVQHPSTKQPASNTNSLEQLYAHAATYISQSPKETCSSDVTWSSTENDDPPPPPSPSSKPQQGDAIGNNLEVKPSFHTINEQQQPEFIYKCKICHADLTSLHYTKRVVHVKQCMAGKQKPPQENRQQLAARTSRPSSDTISKNHIKQQQKQPAIPSITTQQQVPSTTDVACIKSWLQQLGLECYYNICIREEIDLSIVQMITVEEWQEVGVLNRMHQRRLVEGGRKKGMGERQDKRVIRGQQEQHTMMVCDTTREAHAYHHHHDEGEYNINITTTTNDDDDNNNNTDTSVHPTPPLILGHSKAVTAARVAPNSTLWVSAATCQQIAPTLEARLVSLKRRKNGEDADNTSGNRGGGGGMYREEEEELARGIAPLGLHIIGHTATAAAAAVAMMQSRASKLQKLEALREDVRSHEEILKDLKGMVHTLESDLGLDNK